MRWRHKIRRAWPGTSAAAAIVLLAAVAGAQAGCTAMPGRPNVVIGTASPTDIDYTFGGSVCRLFNLDTPRHGLRCGEEPSAGAIANVESLRSGRIDVGIVPSDVLTDALAGKGLFAASGPVGDLRVLFAGHAEIFTLVAQEDAGIRGLEDLRARRLGAGKPGSRESAGLALALAAAGLTRDDIPALRELSPAEQSRLFCANELDAVLFAVGHPNGLIRHAALACQGRLVPIAGRGIDRMLLEHPEYERAEIPAIYPFNPAETATFGVRAVVVTTARMPDAVAYEITRAVFRNVGDFQRLHPAFASLSVPEMARIAGQAPVHAGAARYFREDGLQR